MKIELKKEEIIPYLPYKLKAAIRLREDSSLPVEDDCIVTITCFEVAYLDSEYDEFKPILRPLSDLKTSHNIFEDKAICFIDESDNGGSFTIDDIYFKYKESSFSDWRNAYLLLLKGHFDVFGLIEKGLAIDINTL